MTKMNAQQWSQLDFLINNFYEIVEYKRGRGIYGDRVILKRAKESNAIFGEPGRLYEFYYLDANAVKELPRTVLEKIKIITRYVRSPEDMNVLCDFEKVGNFEPAEWAMDTERDLFKQKSIDFKVLNDVLVERYKLLGGSFISKLNKHREKQYFLASSEGFNFITQEYADKQINII
ncbi:MAG: hypothetical protein IKY10_01380 [Clostridia bacterium]|nr:hypothetical protein [Clostridia bacterium]